MTLPFDHTHDLDLGMDIARSESEIALSQTRDVRLTWNENDVSHSFMTMILASVAMVGWVDVPDSEWGDFRRRRAVDISSFCSEFRTFGTFISSRKMFASGRVVWDERVWHRFICPI